MTARHCCRYSSYLVKVGKETKSQNQLEVVDVAWDETAGVDALDDLLVAHFAAEFKTAQGAAGDISKAPRALAKLRKEVLDVVGSMHKADVVIRNPNLLQPSDSLSRLSPETLSADCWTSLPC